MRIAALLLLVACAHTSPGPTPQVASEPMRATIRSSDSTQQPPIAIVIRGDLFKSMGIQTGTVGTLSLDRDAGGTATGMLAAELTARPGEMSFSVSRTGPELELDVWPSSGATTPRLHARGHTVRVIRGPSGVIAVSTGR